MKRARILALFAVAFAIGPVAHAGIDKVQMPGGADHYAWWPRITAPAGWKAAPDLSLKNGVNILLPAGDNPANPSAMLYANAVANDAVPMDSFIAFDQQAMLQDDPAVQFSRLPPGKTADGRDVRVFQLDTTTVKGDSELMAYVEETDGDQRFVVSFVLSAPNALQRDADKSAFYELIQSYRK